MNPVSLTIFKNKYDNKTHRRMLFDSFDEFENLLYQLSKEPGYKPKKDESVKNSSPLITPAIFTENSTRKNSNVLYWSWVAIDVDSFEGSFEDALEIFKENRFLCYSSASSTIEKPKFRIIFPLTCNVYAKDIKHFWWALNKQVGSLGDPQTKDLSRMFYIPAKYPNSYQFIFSHKDAPILDPFELMSRYPYSDGEKKPMFSSEIQEKLIAYKKEKLTNTSYKWNSYRDCPFVNKKLIAEYCTISETGWYSKMFTILCSIASSAMKKGYPISSREIATLGKELDSDTGNWYSNRPLEMEADRAIEWVMKTI